MEQDKQLKEILLHSAETASPGFTDAVMQRVHVISEAQLYYQPLVSPQLKRSFVIIFGALFVAILCMCLLIALTNLPFFTWIQNIAVPDVDYRTILLFILTFWTVFTINSIIEKNFLLRKGPRLQL